jgi:glycerophosphoryl diester phosphodiesterase
VKNTATSWTLTELTSSNSKTISQFSIALATGANGNTWHIRKFQITKGNRVIPYVPSVSARDTVTAEAVKAATADMFRANWWNNGRIRMAMHQGMRSESQPVGNCELSFRTAGINKAWAIETDLRKTSDGKWVCFHDQSVDTLTDGTGNVADLTYAQIRALHYVSQTTGDVTDQIVPSFEEYLQICKTYNCVPLMEFKIRPTAEDCEDVIELLTNYGIFGYIFITDIVATSATIRAVTDAPLFQIASSIDAYNTVSAYIKASSLRNCGIDFDYNLGDSITAGMISDMHQNGMFCGVYTANNVNSIKDWFALGMDIVTSDRIADLTT